MRSFLMSLGLLKRMKPVSIVPGITADNLFEIIDIFEKSSPRFWSGRSKSRVQIRGFGLLPPTFWTSTTKIGTVIENPTNAIVFDVFGLAETHETGLDSARNHYGQFV